MTMHAKTRPGNDDMARPRGGRAHGRLTPRTALLWMVLLAIGFVIGKFGEEFGVPAPHLLAALVLGLGGALTGLIRTTVPRSAYGIAQAVTGVVIGSYLDVGSLRTAGPALPALGAITAATLGMSMLVGYAVWRTGLVDRATAALGTVAGGSAAIVAASDDLDADARVVAFMQYLRLTLVVLATPLLVRFVLAPHGEYRSFGGTEIEVEWTWIGAAATVLMAGAGAWLGRLVRIPSAILFGPLLLSAMVTASGMLNGVLPPEVVREVAFMVIGLEVGLRFTGDTVRHMRRLLPAALAASVTISVACGVLAWVLSGLTSISLLDSYLATTPGGINAVLATAVAAKANVALVFAVQTLRLFVMALLASSLVRWLVTREPRMELALEGAHD